MPSDFPLRTFYPSYLLFALGLALRAFSRSCGGSWLHVREDGIYFDKLTGEDLGLITLRDNAEKIYNALSVLDFLPLGLLDKTNNPFTNLKMSIEAFTEVYDEKSREKPRLDMLGNEGFAYEYLGPRCTFMKPFFQKSGFPLKELRKFILNRERLSERLVPHYRGCYDIGLKLSGVWNGWIYDTGGTSPQCSEGQFLHAVYNKVLSTELSYDTRVMKYVEKQCLDQNQDPRDLSFYSRCLSLTDFVGNSLQKKAARYDRQRPAHIDMTTRPGRIAYELLLDLQLTNDDVVNEFEIRRGKEYLDMTSGFRDRTIKSIQGVKYLANKFVKANPFLPNYPRRSSGRSRNS